MWKYVTRAVREAVDKGNNLFTCRTVNGQGGLCSVANEPTKCYKVTQTNCDNDSTNHNDTTEDIQSCLKSTFLTAITYSTAVVLGWYTNQWIYLREQSLSLKHCKRYENNSIYKIYKKLQPPYSKLLPYYTVLAQPINQAPFSVQLINNEKEIDSGNVTSSEASDTIENAAEQFAFVTGKLENQLGAAYMQQSEPSTSIGHFEAGALYRNSAAAFNLGLCYELGLGTKQNYEKAAECYQIASELGSTKAMYNLAVYYVQGRGGLPTDFNKARILFQTAADKGHKESIAALRSDYSHDSYKKDDIMEPRSQSNPVFTF